VQSTPVLAQYTISLLDEMGFRHVVHASDTEQATRLWRSAQEAKKPFQLIVCDNDIDKGALELTREMNSLPLVVFSHAQSEQNLRLVARIGLHGLVFRPYGREQLEAAVRSVLKV
jgi:DNA-binding NarL/FixJ family response regulator